MRIHTYSSDNGVLTHRVSHDTDLGGQITVTGDVEPLAGWPTPAMRQAVDGSGAPVAWRVGTDLDGRIVSAQRVAARD